MAGPFRVRGSSDRSGHSAALRLGDYEQAMARFVAMAHRYEIDDDPVAYFAYAARTVTRKILGTDSAC